MAATIELPGVDFGALAHEVIAVKLTEALATSPDGIRAIVQASLGQRVTPENGQPPRYSSDKTIPWVEYVAADMIRAATKKILAERVEAMRPALEKAVDAEIKRSSKTVAVALVDAYTAQCKSGYRITVGMQFSPNTD
jgi:hypothetical protein